MTQDTGRKLRLLKIVEMLRRDSDEQNPLITQTICNRLAEMGISCERRTLTKDVRLLNKSGYEILSCMMGHNKAYFVADRSFSVPELKILIDAVQAASFITDKKSAELIDKLSALGGSYRAEILKSNMVCFNTRKHSNEAIFYNVGYLEEALLHKCKASFFYFDLNENGERVYRKEKQRYVVEPMALVYNDDNYYLMCYSDKYDNICNYRVDRMEAVKEEEEPVNEKAIIGEAGVAEYTEQVFNMYGGEQQEVTLEFDASLIGAVYDKFGEDTKITRDDDVCTATVKVQVSPTFRGWVYQFDGRMKVITPS